MEYSFVKGFLMALLIQCSTSEGLPTSIQTSTDVTLQDGQTLPQDLELSHAALVPMAVPPSLEEVQQAVQEASEQVEGRGAEEVLKELLERVVEAALGQVEGGGEAKADETAEQETVDEDSLGAEEGETESDTEAEMLEQVEEEEVEGEDIVTKGGDASVEKGQGVAEVDVSEGVTEEVEGAVAGGAETAAGSVKETAAGVETGGREAEEMEVIDESLDTDISHDSQSVVEEPAAALDETGGYLVEEEEDEAGVKDSKEQVELSEEKVASETDTLEVEETPAVVEVAVGAEPAQETVVESNPSLADVEHVGDVEGEEKALEEETQVDEMESKVVELPFDNYELETQQTVVGEPVEEEGKINIAKDSGELEEDDQGTLVVAGSSEEVEAEGTEVGEAEGDDRHVESINKEESVTLIHGGGDQRAGEEEQIAFEMSDGSEKEDQEELLISAPESEDGTESFVEQSPENKPPTTSPASGGVEAGENTLRDEISNNRNKIVAPTGDLLRHDHVVAQPTLDDSVKDVLAESPHAEGEKPGEANELVEDTAETRDKSELGLEAWKIGAIFAAVFLVLETIVIIIYILKCRNKSSALALQPACEEGCVEPEAATGGDCSDDTLPAGNGDTQQIAALDPSDAATTLAQSTEEQHKEEHATAMSDLQPNSTEESANTGPGPDSTQDLRTSIL